MHIKHILLGVHSIGTLIRWCRADAKITLQFYVTVHMNWVGGEAAAAAVHRRLSSLTMLESCTILLKRDFVLSPSLSVTCMRQPAQGSTHNMLLR